jgi:predicted Holliday junction resolvase-like endonuclease
MEIKTNKSNVWLIAFILLITILMVVVFYRNSQSRAIEAESEAERKRVMYEVLKEQDRQEKIDACNQAAYETYVADWNNTCSVEGKGNACSLPTWRSEGLNKSYEDALERCLQRYPK